MLKYVLEKETPEELVYQYFPEGGPLYGVVVYNIAHKECTIQILAENDKHRIYALKLAKKIREFARTSNFLKKGTIAWY